MFPCGFTSKINSVCLVFSCLFFLTAIAENNNTCTTGDGKQQSSFSGIYHSANVFRIVLVGYTIGLVVEFKVIKIWQRYHKVLAK